MMKKRFNPITDKSSEIVAFLMSSPDMPADPDLRFKIELSVEEAVENVVTCLKELPGVRAGDDGVRQSEQVANTLIDFNRLVSVISGAIMSWVTVISELSSSIMLYRASTQTLTVSVYTEVIRDCYGNAAAYSTVLTVTSVLSMLLFFKITGKRSMSV